MDRVNCRVCDDAFEPSAAQIRNYHRVCRPCSTAARREWREKNRERHRATAKAWEARAVTRRRTQLKAWKQARNYEKGPPGTAHSRVYEAVKAGRLKKQPCEYCGSHRVHAHHEDYSKPLDVRWLCPLHHGQVHAGIIS